MERAEWFSLVAVVVSIVSAVAAVRSARHAGKTAAVDEERRAEELERQRRAEVTARFETEVEPPRGDWPPPREDHYLILENRGHAPARDISLCLSAPDGGALGDRRVLILDENELPIAVIGPGGTYRIRAIFTWGGAVRFRLLIEWTDDTGRREQVSTLRAV